MTIGEQLADIRIRRILSVDPEVLPWKKDLDRLVAGDVQLSRASALEESVRAVQRMLNFLGYSTTSRGAFAIDGDFGPGTNRGLAQFYFDQDLAGKPTRASLCYPCRFNNAHKRISAVPETKLTTAALIAMLTATQHRLANNEVTLGNFDEAIFHLNAVERSAGLTCRQIDEKYGNPVRAVAAEFQFDPKWILAIIRQETAGIIRPRFEQHKLSAANEKVPNAPLRELRYRSMSIGLGQVMGFHFDKVGAPSAHAMLSSDISEQLRYVARYLSLASNSVRALFSNDNPSSRDFQAMARFYNGPAFAKHRYDEKLGKWFAEFRSLENG